VSASFPRQHARTRRFTLGRPRSFTVGDGVVLFLRSAAGDDPVTDLWRLDLATGEETCLVAAASLVGDETALPAAERARRERAREQAAGITSYATDVAVTVAAFTVAGALHVVDVASGTVTAVATDHVAFDPRPAPDGLRVAFVDEDGVHVAVVGLAVVQPVVAGEGVTWGTAEFIAAEELQRSRGHWWSPDGARLAVTRVDQSRVARWWIGDPANPGTRPTEQLYPAAGTANADVGLSVVELEQRRRVDVRWDREALPYLTDVVWSDDGSLTLVTMDRAQSRVVLHRVDLTNGGTEIIAEHSDPAWVDVVPGAPCWLPDGRLLTVIDDHGLGKGGTRTLAVNGTSVGPAGVQVHQVLDSDATSALVVASVEPTERHLGRIDLATGTVDWITDAPGVHGGVARDGVTVVSVAPRAGRPHVEVRTGRDVWRLADTSETPAVTVRPQWLELGPRGLRGVLLTPEGHDGPLPILLDPYGGPHAQRALAAEQAHLTSQWFADQGFAVLVVDGRGTPGRGPAFEREVRFDLAGPALEDQLDALAAAAAIDDRLDTSRVAIRGWSFGGYLAALAALRRPDVFRAAIVGAPVTDWRLYDTAYTERYLGHPNEHPEAYERSNLISSSGELLGAAPIREGDTPPGMLLIHGLADDNVVAAHALRLSAALLADGRRHEFLPLSGVTHMTPQEIVAENLLQLQLDFLRRHLGR
jgi:dipeptidyl-peptidase-4